MIISKQPHWITRMASRLFTSTGIACALSAAISTPIQVAHADTIELLNEDSLTGTVSAMSNEGASISSPNYVNPLLIHSSAIKRIKFSDNSENTKSHTELITLVNGDSLPCQVLSMDEGILKISTWYAGEFSIPRDNIFSLRFGLSEEKNIYTGGDPTSKWKTAKGWSLKGNGYTSDQSGVLARELPMPENIRIRFDLSWTNTPNFVFRFCAESDSATTKQDTYELTFNTTGIQIRRYKGDKDSSPIASVDLKPIDIDGKQINIDLRVNRSDGSVTLYLDGLKTGTYHDVFDTALGKHIIFNNRASSGTTCNIRNIHVSDWNDGSPTRHLTKVTPSKMDVVIESEGDKRSGKITHILKQANKGRIIQFTDKHSSKPLMMPDHRISVLYFAQSEDTVKNSKPALTANFTGYGSLQLEDPKLETTKIHARHPILGEYSLDRRVVTSITQSNPQTKK